MSTARKLTFQEAWESATIFLVDETLEQEIDEKVAALLITAGDPSISESAHVTVEDIAEFIVQRRDGLDVILKDIQLSDEKFKRIISLLRKLGRIDEPFDVEWSMSKIKRKMAEKPALAHLIAHLLLRGKDDPELQQHVPRYYLERLNYQEIQSELQAVRRIHYKNQLIGTYGARKGYIVENRIKQQLERIQVEYGVSHASGRSPLIETDIDFAIPGVQDPWVIIMSSFQETTSSGQSTKARDMLAAYERVNRHNSRYRESRVFVNFVDGGGWHASKILNVWLNPVIIF
ncbi:MAG: hypothetical protein DDG58_08415 [Ardenticatenia bacterium]|nr:MAG: hypothetical protein DDG58_08415 [Ardenticatenia bacterium]